MKRNRMRGGETPTNTPTNESYDNNDNSIDNNDNSIDTNTKEKIYKILEPLKMKIDSLLNGNYNELVGFRNVLLHGEELKDLKQRFNTILIEIRNLITEGNIHTFEDNQTQLEKKMEGLIENCKGSNSYSSFCRAINQVYNLLISTFRKIEEAKFSSSVDEIEYNLPTHSNVQLKKRTRVKNFVKGFFRGGKKKTKKTKKTNKRKTK